MVTHTHTLVINAYKYIWWRLWLNKNAEIVLKSQTQPFCFWQSIILIESQLIYMHVIPFTPASVTPIKRRLEIRTPHNFSALFFAWQMYFIRLFQKKKKLPHSIKSLVGCVGSVKMAKKFFFFPMKLLESLSK